MAKVNIVATGHGSKVEHYTEGTSIQYNVFPSISAADKKRLAKVTRAYDIINKLDAKIDLQGPCNKYFKTLPKGKAFRNY